MEKNRANSEDIWPFSKTDIQKTVEIFFEIIGESQISYFLFTSLTKKSKIGGVVLGFLNQI